MGPPRDVVEISSDEEEGSASGKRSVSPDTLGRIAKVDDSPAPVPRKKKRKSAGGRVAKDDDDCVILDNDPHILQAAKVGRTSGNTASDEVEIVAVTGEDRSPFVAEAKKYKAERGEEILPSCKLQENILCVAQADNSKAECFAVSSVKAPSNNVAECTKENVPGSNVQAEVGRVASGYPEKPIYSVNQHQRLWTPNPPYEGVHLIGELSGRFWAPSPSYNGVHLIGTLSNPFVNYGSIFI